MVQHTNNTKMTLKLEAYLDKYCWKRTPARRTHIVQWVELWSILDQSEAPSKLFVNSTCVDEWMVW